MSEILPRDLNPSAIPKAAHVECDYGNGCSALAMKKTHQGGNPSRKIGSAMNHCANAFPADSPRTESPMPRPIIQHEAPCLKAGACDVSSLSSGVMSRRTVRKPYKLPLLRMH